MCKCTEFRCLSAFALAAILSVPSFAQDKKDPKPADKPAAAKPDDKKPADKGAAPAGGMDQKMMDEMMKLSQPGENHKLLENMVGNWTFTTKMWMNPDPAAPPQESKGTAKGMSVLGGRFIHSEVKGSMPGFDGKPMDFEGAEMTGYDNVKKKFVSSWADNMGTMIMVSEGTYDAATKTFTYTSEMEPMPGMKAKVKFLIKVTDKDHHTMEWYEDQGGTERKTMEIAYTRAK